MNNMHRTWKQWFLMHWVVGTKIKTSETNEIIFRTNTSRWIMIAWFHMMWIQWKLEIKYPNFHVISWLDWEK